MDIRPIKTKEDHEWALAEINQYFDHEPELGSEDGDRFEVLLSLIGAYEDKHYPIHAPQPVELIKAHMEIFGRKQSDLAKLFGSSPRASEVLNKKRSLTTDMIWKLYKEWGIPAECLIEPYHLAEPVKVYA